MTALSRWLVPATLALGLGLGAMAPAQAQSQDELIRVLVNVADVVFRGSTPYYRQGDYGQDDRLTVQRDRYGRPVYYRSVPRSQYYGNGYGNGNGNSYGNDGHPRYSNGSHNNGSHNNGSSQRTKCNKHGKCKVEYYDSRYDHSGRNDQVRYDRDGRYWDGRQWRYSEQRYSRQDRDDDDDD
ncbi:MAG: hypothetical protein WKF61_12435 [Luteimonas sp.]